MDIRQLHYAIILAEEQNFSKAAKRLHIAQPSLSQAIAALERKIGVQLFDRSAAPLKLTHAGEIFLDRARHIRNMHTSLLREMEAFAAINANVLSVGIGKGRCSALLSKVLPLFHAKHPAVELNIHEGYTSSLLEWLRNGITDLNIMHLNGNHPGLEQRLLHRDEMVVLLPPGHPLQDKVRRSAGRRFPLISLSELREEKFIFPKSGLRFRSSLDRLFSEAGYKPNIILEVPDRELANEMTAAGMGISFAMCSTEKTPAFSEEVLCCTLNHPVPHLVVNIIAVYRTGNHLSRAAEDFIKIAKSLLRQ